MLSIFHGKDEKNHESFQLWRRDHPNGFHMTEGPKGTFTIHWAQDKRENQAGRGCHHQGVSIIKYLEDAGSCYTAARKVCSDDLRELVSWAEEQQYKVKRCQHCDTRKFPFPARSSA